MAAAAAGVLATATPAYADPVKAGPATPDELAVMAVGGAVSTPSTGVTDQVALNRLSTSGAYRGRVVFPATAAGGVLPLTISSAALNGTLRKPLRRSGDGRYLTFTGIDAAAGLSSQDRTKSTAVRVGADGTWTTTPFGTGYVASLGFESVGTVSADGSRYWTAVNATTKGLGTLAPGDTAVSEVSARIGDGSHMSLDIVDGELWTTTNLGVYRRPGALPVAQDTTTPLQRIIALTDVTDGAFVDTDGVAGVDTGYLTRGARGISKFVLSGGTWQARGRVSGSFGSIAVRAVAGAVEIYATDVANVRVQKVVDTAEIGGALTSTGPTTLAFAPSRTRYTGLAFAPGTGFTGETTAYPATPPSLFPSATTLDSSLQATPKASIVVDVADPNSPASELTLTGTSSDQTVLPNAKIEVTGTGTRRTVTFDPVAVGNANVTLTVAAGGEQATATIALRVTGVAPDPTSHYYSGAVDLSASLDVGEGYFLGISDEVNTPLLYKAGVSGAPIASFPNGFPGGEGDFEGVTRAGDLVIWTGSHGNNRSGSARPERRYLAFERITGSGDGVDLEWVGNYTRLWTQWKAWDAANGHGLGANYLKFNTATVPGLIPNAPNGFNVEGLTMAPGSTAEAWFGMRAPTITGADGIERALILPVKNIDKLTSDAVDAELGHPILLNLGGRSIRDISKNAHDQYLITAGTGDTDDSLKNWALYTWDGNPAHDPQFVNELPTNESQIGAWEGIASVPDPLVPGAKALLTADSGDSSLGGKSYGQYVTIGEPVAGPAVVSGVTATAKPGAIDIAWNPASRATRYQVSVKTPAGAHAPGSPFFVTGTSKTLEGLTAGTEYSVTVRAENVATRSANSDAAKATPTQGERIATTTSFAIVGGGGLGSQPYKLVATVSDPRATGTIQFYNGTQTLQDAIIVDPVPGQNYNVARSVFPVVDGKAEINLSSAPGLLNLQAKYTTSNAENFLSSDSTVIPQFFAYRPVMVRAEIVSVTGDRHVGGRVAFKVKMIGGKPSELYTGGRISVEFGSRINGSTTRTRLVGDTAETQNGSVYLDENGEATFATTQLAAGEHRIGGNLANFSTNYGSSLTDEIPITIAAAAPASEAPAVKRNWVGLSIAPTARLTTTPVTLSARVWPANLTGTVQFFYGSGTNLGPAVPVVNGVATTTATFSNATSILYARFEPAADRTTTISATSLGVPIQRGTTAAPITLPPATATTTTLELSGERVDGSPLTANVTVAPAGGDANAARDTVGYVEVTDKGAPIGYAHVVAGKASVALGALDVGSHTVAARFVSSDELRSLGSAALGQTFDVVVKTDANGSAGGVVPATLALTLGVPASFSTFVPGLEKTYAASTTATVLSTAGDATLTVVDPSATAPGRLVNGAFSLAAPLQVRASGGTFAPVAGTPAAVKTWNVPAANDAVRVEFQQAIGANEGLRTGQYGKALTFTLSTTTP